MACGGCSWPDCIIDSCLPSCCIIFDGTLFFFFFFDDTGALTALPVPWTVFPLTKAHQINRKGSKDGNF